MKTSFEKRVAAIRQARNLNTNTENLLRANALRRYAMEVHKKTRFVWIEAFYLVLTGALLAVFAYLLMEGLAR